MAPCVLLAHLLADHMWAGVERDGGGFGGVGNGGKCVK